MENNEMSGTLPAFLGDQLSLFSLLVDNNNFRCAGGKPRGSSAACCVNLLGYQLAAICLGMLASLWTPLLDVSSDASAHVKRSSGLPTAYRPFVRVAPQTLCCMNSLPIHGICNK